MIWLRFPYQKHQSKKENKQKKIVKERENFLYQENYLNMSFFLPSLADGGWSLKSNKLCLSSSNTLCSKQGMLASFFTSSSISNLTGVYKSMSIEHVKLSKYVALLYSYFNLAKEIWLQTILVIKKSITSPATQLTIF